MQEYGPRYEEHLRPFLQSKCAEVPFYSTVTGERLTGDDLGASYWRQNMETIFSWIYVGYSQGSAAPELPLIHFGDWRVSVQEW